jgi:hypothetical protein
MSEKFRQMGDWVYVDAAAAKESNRRCNFAQLTSQKNDVHAALRNCTASCAFAIWMIHGEERSHDEESRRIGQPRSQYQHDD